MDSGESNMLRTYFQQNEDWFANSDHPFSRLGEMDSEIAELRTLTKVTRLRKQIECREEGAWMVIKDVPDENAPSGSRKVTAYGRTRRSVVRSVSSNSNFDNVFPQSATKEPLVQHPPDEETDVKDTNSTSVEISEVFDEPLRGNIVEADKSCSEKTNQKKTSVVTLGEGNIVLIDPEKESNFHVTGVSKGKVADVVSSLERIVGKKTKKVGFCKTEVHFAPDSGKINIVETDEKPPPTQVYRRKKRTKSSRKESNCLPKHYFGDMSDLGDDSNLSNESDKEDSRPPLSFPPSIEAIPQVKQTFPAFERTIKSEGKDVKYRHSSPEKIETDFGLDKLQVDDKEFVRKLKQPSFRDKFLKETDVTFDKSSNVSYTPIGGGHVDATPIKHSVHLNGISQVNGLSSKHKVSEDLFSNFNHSNESPLKNEEIPELKYTELFKLPSKENDVSQGMSDSVEDLKVGSEVLSSKINGESEKTSYNFSTNPKMTYDEKDTIFFNVSRVPIDQDIKPDMTFLGSMSPKLKSLIQNSVEHEFQLKQKQIIQRKSLERRNYNKDSSKIKSSINIRLPTPEKVEEKKSIPSEVNKSKTILTQVEAKDKTPSKHEFQLKRDEITKYMYSDPLYSNTKELEFKEMPYLLNEEPVPVPREKSPNKLKPETMSSQTPKPKPRTMTSSSHSRSGKQSARLPVGKTTFRSETSSLSRRARSKESLVKVKEAAHSRSSQNKEDSKTRKLTTTKIESGSERISRTNVQPPRKVVRGEPLRSFEKVSNGWVGVVKKDERETPGSTATTTTKAYPTKSLTELSTQQTSGNPFLSSHKHLSIFH